MINLLQDFSALSPDAQRTEANLEQGYAAWLDTQRALAALPASLYWAAKPEADYLTAKYSSSDNGSSLGVRSSATEAQYAAYVEERGSLKVRAASLGQQLAERIALYRTRALQLPLLADEPAEILRLLDVEDFLGRAVLVVGTNAFAAYQLACGARFPTGNESTEGIDLAWCRGTRAAMLVTGKPAEPDRPEPAERKSLFNLLRQLDASYRINSRTPYQAVNAAGYEVELLAAPSTHPLPKNEAFDPMASLIEQEWLLLGRPVTAVVATPRGRVCPLVVPDPRWMALHKLWLADKPERKASKKDKDRRQGHVLLDAVRYFLASSHPIDLDFVLDLPAELRPVFDNWAAERAFVPVDG